MPMSTRTRSRRSQPIWPRTYPSRRAPASTAPLTTASFQGVPATGWRPSDTSIAVGQDRALLGVNTDLAGYDKGGALQFRWNNMTALFQNVLPPQSTFDPALFYDHYAHRYVVVVAARRQSPAGSWVLVGVSQSENPGGTYWIWALDQQIDGSNQTSNWADYPKVGFDTQAVYISTNQFQIGGSGDFQYAKLRAPNKSELYSGAAVHWYDFWDLDKRRRVGRVHGPAGQPFPRPGRQPAGLLRRDGLYPSGSQLMLWTLADPIGWWGGTSPSLAKKAVDCRPYDFPPNALQKGSTNRISTNDPRLLNAVYQNAGRAAVAVDLSYRQDQLAGRRRSEKCTAVVRDRCVDGRGGSSRMLSWGAGEVLLLPGHSDRHRPQRLSERFCCSGDSEYVNVRQTGRRGDRRPRTTCRAVPSSRPARARTRSTVGVTTPASVATGPTRAPAGAMLSTLPAAAIGGPGPFP